MSDAVSYTHLVATVKSPTWGSSPRKVPAGGCFLAITAQTDEQKEAAWEFEKYLYSVESMAAWTKMCIRDSRRSRTIYFKFIILAACKYGLLFISVRFFLSQKM